MNVISLFAGCGGCTLGLVQAGFEVRLAAELDPAACATYAQNFPHHPLWQTDLTHIQPTELLSRAGLTGQVVDLVVGGPPCQGFSSAGGRDWHDPRNALLKRFVEFVIAIKPTWFVLENVEGLLTAKDGFYLIEAISHFLQAGYWVRGQKVYMEQYGLPQKRKRLFLVGNLEECAFQFPIPTFLPYAPLPLLAQEPQRTLWDALGDLPQPTEAIITDYAHPAQNRYQTLLRRTDGQPLTHHTIKKTNDLTQTRLEALEQGQTMKDLPPHLQHPSFQRRALRRVMDGTPSAKRGGAPAGLKRLTADQPALTITSAATAEFVHPLEDRLLTLRECARLQSFPDWFEFSGSWTSVATQIGNAIPPLFMAQLGQHIQQYATGKRHETTHGRWLGLQSTQSNGLSPALQKTLAYLDQKTYAYAR